MKRLISTILIMTISASLVACSSADDSKDTTKATKEETEISETEKVTETSSEETTVETTTEETTTSAEETTKAGSVNPDDFWDTGEDGRPLFHIDEYAEALGYIRRYRTPGTFIIECGPDYILYSCLINKFQYASEEEPIVTYEWGGEDSNQIWVEYNDHIGLCGEGKIYDMIAALETFSNYEYTPGVAPEAPNGWVADYENDDWIF